jgi:hypothetical protein
LSHYQKQNSNIGQIAEKINSKTLTGIAIKDFILCLELSLQKSGGQLDERSVMQSLASI